MSCKYCNNGQLSPGWICDECGYREPMAPVEALLNDLVGIHILTGVDERKESIRTYGDQFQDCNVINFTLDGKTYTACEDPDDGYRSRMRYLRVSETPTTNTFEGCRVMGKMQDDSDYEKNDVLILTDVATGDDVLEVGTSNTDDYYPSFVASFHPERMSVNRVRL